MKPLDFSVEGRIKRKVTANDDTKSQQFVKTGSFQMSGARNVKPKNACTVLIQAIRSNK